MRFKSFSTFFTDKTNHSLNQRKNISRSLRSSHANRFSFAHTGHQRRRRSYSWDYFVEVMVVADARLRRYHDKNLENYIVTLLSIVNDAILDFLFHISVSFYVFFFDKGRCDIQTSKFRSIVKRCTRSPNRVRPRKCK